MCLLETCSKIERMCQALEERIKMIKAMEYIARQINDEDILGRWLVCGVADGDIDYGDLTAEEDLAIAYYTEDEHFADLMDTFLWVMGKAYKSGGLYCDGLASRTI